MSLNLIKPDERIDELQIDGLKIIQNPSRFCFGTDAVLLSDFAAKEIKKNAVILDMCSGNGIIGILLSSKSLAKKIYSLEIQKDVFDMSKRSVEMNDLSSKIIPFCGDLKEGDKLFGRSFFNNIVCNPPYKEAGSGLTNKCDPIAIARHEIMCSLEDVIRTSCMLLKPYGKLHLIHRPERLADIMCLMRKYKMEPKRLRFIYPMPHKTATMIMIDGAYLGRPKLRLEPPLYVYEKPGEYSAEVNRIYGR